MPHYSRDIEVRLTLLPTEEMGGLKQPVVSGFRPQFYYDGHDWDAVHTYPDDEEVSPGQTARAFLSFLNPEEHEGKLCVGTPFLLRAGQVVFGYGVVTKLLELTESAKRMRALKETGFPNPGEQDSDGD